MTIWMETARRPFGALLAAAACLSVLSTAAMAYTAQQQQDCTGDAFRLCSAEIPDVDRVTVCMVRNRSQLSPGCRVHFRSDAERAPRVAPVIAGAPVSIRPKLGKASGGAKSTRAKSRKPI